MALWMAVHLAKTMVGQKDGNSADRSVVVMVPRMVLQLVDELVLKKVVQ